MMIRWLGRTGRKERERSAAARAQAEREVIGPLRELREKIISAPGKSPDPDLFARAIREVLRGE